MNSNRNVISTPNSHYFIEKEIERGAQGIVYLAETKKSKKVAIKVTNLNTPLADMNFKEEKSIIKHLQKEKVPICNVKEMTVMKNKGITIMKCYQKDLFTLAIRDETLNEAQVQSLFRDICKSIAKMHKAGVAHLDIKPENFLLDAETNKAVICDFGASLMSTCGNTDSLIFNDPQSRGTKQYMSPEATYSTQCDAYKCDSFALGVTLFVLLSRRYPFDGKSFSGPAPSENLNVSFECQDLLKSLLCLDPESRISVSKALSHPWLEKSSKRAKLANFAKRRLIVTNVVNNIL